MDVNIDTIRQIDRKIGVGVNKIEWIQVLYRHLSYRLSAAEQHLYAERERDLRRLFFIDTVKLSIKENSFFLCTLNLLRASKWHSNAVQKRR